VVKTITESGLEMTDRLIHTGYDVMRDVVGSAASSVRHHERSKPLATKAH
jgi:CO dehydrogenase nickel-insertion accessory protein CooC1